MESTLEEERIKLRIRYLLNYLKCKPKYKVVNESLINCIFKMVDDYIQINFWDTEEEIIIAAILTGIAAFGLDEEDCYNTLYTNEEDRGSEIWEYVENTIKPLSSNPEDTFKRIKRIQMDMLESENYTPCKSEMENINECPRCKKLTKAGKQCSRDAQSGEIFCWQHAV